MKNKTSELEKIINGVFLHGKETPDLSHNLPDGQFTIVEAINLITTQILKVIGEDEPGQEHSIGIGMQNTLRKEQRLRSLAVTKPKMYVSHGNTHPVGEPCKTCEEAEAEFQKDLASGEVARQLSTIKEPTTKKCNCHYQCGCDKGKCNCYKLKQPFYHP